MRALSSRVCLLFQRSWQQRLAVWPSVSRDGNDTAQGDAACFFIQAAEHGVSDSIISARFWALAESGRLCANEGVLVLLLSELRANVLDRGLVRLIFDSAADLWLRS